MEDKNVWFYRVEKGVYDSTNPNATIEEVVNDIKSSFRKSEYCKIYTYIQEINNRKINVSLPTQKELESITGNSTYLNCKINKKLYKYGYIEKQIEGSRSFHKVVIMKRRNMIEIEYALGGAKSSNDFFKGQKASMND